MLSSPQLQLEFSESLLQPLESHLAYDGINLKYRYQSFLDNSLGFNILNSFTNFYDRERMKIFTFKYFTKLSVSNSFSLFKLTMYDQVVFKHLRSPRKKLKQNILHHEDFGINSNETSTLLLI